MKTISPEGFKLPFIGKDKFAELMRVGVGYDRSIGIFFLRNKSNQEVVKNVLEEILKEKIEFQTNPVSKTQTCFLCDKQVVCQECEYYTHCPTKEQSFKEIGLYCLCQRCAGEEESYVNYIKKSAIQAQAKHDNQGSI